MDSGFQKIIILSIPSLKFD